MNILVSGGAGFLGTNLCLKLIKEGHFVTILDNFSTGRHKNIKFLQENCKDIHQLKVIDIDITNPSLLRKEWQRALLPPKIDQIYHLASPASPPKYQRDPIFTLDTNYLGTKHMLELALKYNARMLFTSTSEVYGDPKVHPQHEGYWGNVSLYSKRSCYDEGKRVAEVLCYEYERKYSLDIRVARLFNTYGPWMEPDDGRVISNFITQMLKKQPITIYGTGTQTRSFCYVDDMIEALHKFMNYYKIFNPINIGNPNEFMIYDLYGLLCTESMQSLDKIHTPLPDGDPRQRKPDITKAKQVLNWEPKIELKEGLKKTIEWFRKELLIT